MYATKRKGTSLASQMPSESDTMSADPETTPSIGHVQAVQAESTVSESRDDENMEGAELVRSCPYCPSHSLYPAGALQCIDCGALRPRRVVWIRWEGGSPELRAKAQTAVDLCFHTGNFSGEIDVSATVLDQTLHLTSVFVRTVGTHHPNASGPISRQAFHGPSRVLSALREHGITSELI